MAWSYKCIYMVGNRKRIVSDNNYRVTALTADTMTRVKTSLTVIAGSFTVGDPNNWRSDGSVGVKKRIAVVSSGSMPKGPLGVTCGSNDGRDGVIRKCAHFVAVTRTR